MNVTLIDYGAGNLRSVCNALRALGVEPSIAATAGDLDSPTHLVLPGVGSFGDCMAQLDHRGFLTVIRDWVAAGKPYLGICLGYQILFDSSEESPGVAGLGIVPGDCRCFTRTPGLKIPHMGWNSVIPTNPQSSIWAGLGEEPYFYHVHSYFPVPAERNVIAATTSYGEDDFASAIEMPNLFACQFHPEKSQDAGLRLIRNFIGRQASNSSFTGTPIRAMFRA